MTPEEWRLVCDIFAATVRREISVRGKLLDEACAGKPEIRAEVERLLAFDEPTQEEPVTEIDPATRSWANTSFDESTQDEDDTADGEPTADRRPAKSDFAPDHAPLAAVAGMRHMFAGLLSHAALHLFCPHCRNPIDLVASGEAEEVLCPSCGSTFKVDVGRRARGEGLGRAQARRAIQVAGESGLGWIRNGLQGARPAARPDRRAQGLARGELASEEHKDRFLREARNAAQLRHPSIVPVHEIGDQDGVPFIVSDYIEGVTVSEVAGRLSPFIPRVCPAGRLACRGAASCPRARGNSPRRQAIEHHAR